MYKYSEIKINILFFFGGGEDVKVSILSPFLKLIEKKEREREKLIEKVVN